MTTTHLFVVHVALFSAIPVALVARPWRLANALIYAYVAVVVLLGGFLGGVYSLPVGSVVVSGGSLAYGATVFTALVLLFNSRDPQAVRDLVKIVALMSVFKVAFALLATATLENDGVLNPFATAADLFDTSTRLILLGGLLNIAELLLLVAACERVKSWRDAVPGHVAWYVAAYVLVLAADGVLFPVLVTGIDGSLVDAIREGVESKLVLAVAYAVPLVAFVVLFRGRVARYEERPIRLGELVRAPKPVLVREIERQHHELEYQATHDAMTGLANREELVHRTRNHLGRCATDQCLAVLFIDLDDFKLINDGHGHAAGDAVLMEVGERIRSCLREGDVAARLGGDEFCALVTDLTDTDTALEVGRRILQRLSEPIALEHTTVSVNASVGVAFAGSGQGSPEPDVLIHNADLAMYRAKDLGKDRMVVYTRELHQQAQARAEMLGEIGPAVEAGEFVVHYQPQVELSTGRTVGIEALVRWNHPRRGLLQPAEFVPQAEATPGIVALGEQVLAQACADAVRWGPGRVPTVPVSVNVSARQLRDPHFVALVAGALRRSGLPPELLTLEITESSLMSDVHTSLRTVDQLKALGCSLAIDDFGTGFSSLAYLHQLPVDILKIDKSFVDRVCDVAGATGAPLVQSIIALGELLDLTVIAEGVESEGQRKALVGLGCEVGQGHHFSPAMTAGDIADLLAAEPQVIDLRARA